MINIQKFDQSDKNFEKEFAAFLDARNQKKLLQDENVLIKQVSNIISSVKCDGFNALVELTEKYDGWQPKNFNELCFTQADFKAAFDDLDAMSKKALKAAKKRIIKYHQQQIIQSFQYHDQYENKLGQLIRPIGRVGIYVPGGSAAYPSSVLMNALPAKVAKVSEIVMVVPTPKGEVNPLVLAAAYLAGVQTAYRIGGAQAIAALSYGIQEKNHSIKAVDKIVGPGNQYVAEAKRQVFGDVGIDMIAGPSELSIVCDESANIDSLCLDLFAQAEHDELAQSILISTSAKVISEVEKELINALEKQPRKKIIKAALENKGALIKVHNLDSAINLVNKIAPEHLELAFENASNMVNKIKNAGAIFVGHYSAEVFGDYCAGPSHVLPTSKSARFSSPLGVYDFQKRISVVECSKKGAHSLAKISSVIAEKEGLFAHRDSAKLRLKRKKQKKLKKG